MSIFAKFNKQVDKDQLAKDIEKARENSANFKEVPHGVYEVEIQNIECKETKNGDPMVSVCFNILDGEYKGCKIFANKVVKIGGQYQGLQMAKAIELLESFGSEIDNPAHNDFEVLESWSQEVFDRIQELGLEYELDYHADKKGYDQHEIKEIFEG